MSSSVQRGGARLGGWRQETEHPVEEMVGSLCNRYLQVAHRRFSKAQVLGPVRRRHHAHWQAEVHVRVRQQRFQCRRGLDHRPLLQMVFQVHADLDREPLQILGEHLLHRSGERALGTCVFELPKDLLPDLPAQRARILPAAPDLSGPERPRPGFDCALVTKLNGVRPTEKVRHPTAVHRRSDVDQFALPRRQLSSRDGGIVSGQS